VAAKWFKEIQEFRAWENEHLFGAEPASTLDVSRHRYHLSTLTTDGEMLLLGFALNNDLESLSTGVTRESIEANLRCLRLTFADWYGGMPNESRRGLLKEVFPDAQPAT